MSEVTVIRIGVATRVFKRHGACANGAVIFRKKLTRVQRLAFMSQHPACLVAMVASATADCWGREIEKLGHTVRLIAPSCVKSFVKRQMNDVADAETVVEAAQWAQTMPSAGPITALATETFAPDLNCLSRVRDFAAWLGLVPQQNATGGKPRLGKTIEDGPARHAQAAGFWRPSHACKHALPGSEWPFFKPLSDLERRTTAG
jgi:transposase